jgi:hypothetical protein
MEIAATVRVKPESGEKPDRQRLEAVAKALQDSGFQVSRIGRFGVTIKGESDTFSKVLGIDAERGQALDAKVKSSRAEFRDLVDGVEIVPDPQLY